MRKSCLVFLCTLILFVLVSPRAQALDIVIQRDGTVQFFGGQVLGESDQERPETNSVEVKSEEVKEKEVKRVETKREDKPTRTITKSENTQVRLRENQKQTEVVLEKRRASEKAGETKKSTENFENKQILRTDSVRMELPASEKPEKPEDEREHALEQETETPERRAAQQERADRKTENIQVESHVNDDGTTEFQLQSRGVQATIKNAELVVNPETNGVSLVTPSGESVELVHLPDQARERMQEAGLIESGNTSQDIEVEANDVGETVFRVKQEKSKRFLGLIPRKVATQVEFNDQTGEVQESDVPTSNALVRLLNQLSL